MKNPLKGRLLVLIGQLLVSATINANGNQPLGFQLTENDKVTVEVYRQGEAYFGKIVALKKPLYPADDASGMAGQPKVDRNNPNPDK